MTWELSDNIAPLNGVRYLNNLLPRPLGALSTRSGRQRRHPIDAYTANSAIRVLDVFRYRSSSGDYFDIAVIETATDNRIVRMEASGWTEMKTGLTAGARTIAMKSRNRLMLFNGVDTPQVYLYTGSTHYVRDFGVGDGPAATAVQGIAPGQTGDYSYKVTAVYTRDGETDPGTVSATVTVANKSVDVTWPAVVPPKGMTTEVYRIWRKRTDAGNVWDTWYLVDEVDSATLAYNDTETDATVYASGAGQKIHSNHDEPSHQHKGAVWWPYENRAAYWTTDNKLHFSDVGFPEQVRHVDDSFDTTNLEQFIYVPQDDDSNAVISLMPVERNLYVFNEYGARQIVATGNVALPYVVSTVSNSEDQGLIGSKALAATDEGAVYYLSTKGIRKIFNRVDMAVNPADEGGALDMVSNPAPANTGPSVSAIVGSIPVSLRDEASAVVFEDLIHFAIAATGTDGVAPVRNNDVLIFDLQTQSFTYRSGANVNDFEVANDSSGGTKLMSASNEAVMLFTEYVADQENDEPAAGAYSGMVNEAIAWEVEDYDRQLAGMNTALMDRAMLDAAAGNAASSTTDIAFEARVDGGRKSVVKSFSYGAPNQTVWNDTAYLETVDVLTTIATWNAVTDGEMRITIDGTAYDVTAMDFSADADMDDIAATIQAALRTATSGTEYVEYDGDEIRISSDDVTASSEVSTLTTHSAPTGTDISTATYLDGSTALEVARGTFTGTPLVWGTEFDVDAEHLWSEQANERTQPKIKPYSGLRGMMLAVRLTGEGPIIIYGWRVDYFILQPQARAR
jgi:hypothetical protein